MAITEESETDPVETETIITEPEPKQEPKVQKQETPPAETEKHERGGIVIGNPTPEQTYSCGVAGHHCTESETHSYICELEQKGCEYCGSHTCPNCGEQVKAWTCHYCN